MFIAYITIYLLHRRIWYACFVSFKDRDLIKTLILGLLCCTWYPFSMWRYDVRFCQMLDCQMWKFFMEWTNVLNMPKVFIVTFLLKLVYKGEALCWSHFSPENWFESSSDVEWLLSNEAFLIAYHSYTKFLNFYWHWSYVPCK